MAKWLSLIAFILAAGAAYLGMESKGLVEKMQQRGTVLANDLRATKDKLAATEKTLKETTEKLDATTKDLEATRAAKVEVEGKLTAVTADLESIKKQIAEALGGEIDISKGIAGLKEKITELTTAKTTMEGQVKSLTEDKMKLEGELAEKEKGIAELKSIVAAAEQKAKEDGAKLEVQGKKIKQHEEGIIQQGLAGRVLAVNSGWGFCVISVGDKQGAAPNRELVVGRNGQAIGKIKITNVERNQSIADIIPSTFGRNFIQPGDEVIYDKPNDRTMNAVQAGGAAGGAAEPVLPSRN